MRNAMCLLKMHANMIAHDNPRNIVALLKACARQKDLHKGSCIHADILRSGLLTKSPYVANALVNMYAKCGALAQAQHLLHQLPHRDVVSWNALISGYAQHGHCEDALRCFEWMQHEGLCPNAVTFCSMLKACGNVGAADKGKQIHDEIVRQGLLRTNILLGNALVDMYAKSGELSKAHQVLEELPARSVVSWTSLIAGYAQHGHGEEAIICFEQMQHEGLSPNAITFSCILKACGSIGAVDKGKQIHDEIARQGLLGTDVVLGNALVDMYAKCGVLVKAQEVFDELPVWNVVSWSTLIAGYAQHGHGESALHCFEQMERNGLCPDAVTFACILKACGSMGAADKGKLIHDQIARHGLIGTDLVLGNALVDMYVKCGELARAQIVLDELPVQDVLTWNVLITGYAQHGQGETALDCFERMQQQGVHPNAVTLACVLKVCGSIRAVDRGRQIHDEIVRQGLLGTDIVLGTALVDMYARCGVLTKAHAVLDKLPLQDIAAWNALIAGCAQHGHGEEALNCFEQLRSNGLYPDSVTFACILKACGSVGAADKGMKMHDEIVRRGFLGTDIVLGNALVDMYAKCGMLAKAAQVLDELPFRDIVSWSALIAGYAQHGHGEEALRCFERMQWEGLCPTAVTFGCVLNAFSHSGLLDEAQMYFANMNTTYGITPDLEHFTCMVDLFGRAGHFDKAIAVVKKMPSSDYLPAWAALLGACQKWGNVKLGRLAFERAVKLDGKCATAYVCMSNMYLAAGMREDANRIEAMRIKYEA